MALIRGRSARAVLLSALRSLTQVPRLMISYLAKRNRRVWVFGNIHGFRDSPRYMAEYVVNSDADVEVWWIAHAAESAEAARRAGLHVAMAGDRESARVQRKAGVAFFTHGFRDLDLPQLSGAFLVFLWHGTPLKRIGLDVSGAADRRRPLPLRLAARTVRWLHIRAYRLVDFFVAAGELDAERFATAFGAPPSRIKVLGSPRFDVIRGGAAYERVIGEDLRSLLGLGQGDAIVLWLPTHRREYGDDAWLPELTTQILDAGLADTNFRLLVKPHPNADWDIYRQRIADDPRIRLLNETDVDVNALLHIADALISDYSSVVFDYAILRRPIYFLAPDIDRYDANRGLYDPYDVLTGGRHHAAWPSLLAALGADSTAGDESEGMRNCNRVAGYCRNNTEPEACARITATILRLTRR